MSDLKLTQTGDLEIIQRSEAKNDKNQIVKEVYDLNITKDYTKDLILKAIKTPQGRITLPILGLEDITLFDKEYGSRIYKELSEGITLNFLSRVKSYVVQSLANANLISNVREVDVSVLNSNTIQLNISYTNSSNINNIEINL
jgi:hypothetical protein